MFGIPFEVRRFDEGGQQNITLFVRSHRRSEMRDALRELHETKVSRTVQALQMQHAVKVATDEATDAALAEVKGLAAELAAIGRKIENLTETIARLALADNYGPAELNHLLDMLTDAELEGIVSTVEMGQAPADFSVSGAIQPSLSSSGLNGGSPDSTLPGPGGAGTTSRPAA